MRPYGSAEQRSERTERSEEDSSLPEEGEEALKKNKVSEEENAGTPSGTALADRPSEEQQDREDEGDLEDIEVAAEDASWFDMETGNTEENAEVFAMDTVDFEAVDAETVATPVQTNGVGNEPQSA